MDAGQMTSTAHYSEPTQTTGTGPFFSKAEFRKAKMLLAGVFVVIVSMLVWKLVSISGVGRCQTWKDKVLYMMKFMATYPIVLAKFRKRRSPYQERRHLKNFSKNVLPVEEDWVNECPRKLKSENEMDTVHFMGVDKTGNCIFLSLSQTALGAELLLVVLYDGKTYTLPDGPRTMQHTYSNEIRAFVGKGFRLEIREPCKKWRVWINTTVRNGTPESIDEDETNLVHLSLHGWWASNTDIFDFGADQDAGLVSRCIARNNWNGNFMNVAKVNVAANNQWGHLIGQLKIGGVSTEISMHCLKSRLSANLMWNWLGNANVYIAVLENGTYLLVGALDLASILKSFRFGYVCWPNGRFASITDTRLASGTHNEPEQPDGMDMVQFSCDDMNFVLSTKTETEVSFSIGHDNSDCDKALLKLCQLQFNGQNGHGVRFVLSNSTPAFTPQNTGTTEDQPYHPEKYGYTADDSELFVLPLCHRAARYSELTGGKGCNLAALTEQQGQFIVPGGFCITTSAYSVFVEADQNLNELIGKLHEYGRLSDDELERTCDEIVNVICQTELSYKLRSAVQSELRRSFGVDWEKKKFAVRSSAVGEDSADLSTAGQLETFLQRKGMESICQAIRLCWASHFRTPSIQYKKQHGQSLTVAVAVVVQEMVEPDVSGVLFTVDPIDGDPLKMVINANPGLGELIVSGSVIPDTIVLQRSYFKENVTWREAVLGGERTGGECCLDESLAIKLANIGIMVEQFFHGKPQDIEWAIKDGVIYLLQSRAITSLDIENQYDLMHELDDGIKNEDDVYTTANAGEVMAEPQTPLSLSTQVTAVDLAIQEMIGARGVIGGISPLCRVAIHSHCQRALFNMMGTFYREIGHMKNTRVPEICFMGRPLNMPSVKTSAVERYGKPSVLVQVYRMLCNIRTIFFVIPEARKRLRRAAEKKPDTDAGQDAKAMYVELGKKVQELAEGWRPHLLISMGSSVAYHLVAAVLLPSDPDIELATDHYADIATLFSSCQNVISADVPAALKEICSAIHSAGLTSNFREMTDDDTIEWLNGSESGVAGEKFRRFLDTHGHRSIAEMDIGAVSWKTDPRPIISTLRQMLADDTTVCNKKEEISVGEAIRKLKRPTNWIQRLLLKKLMPYARDTVVQREHSKDFAIKVTNAVRNRYRQLGSLLKEMGYLPNEKLIFYLTHIEIGDLIEKRPAKLVAKAVRRQKLMKTLKTFRYPEMIIGHPQPLKMETVNGAKGSSSATIVRGTPVSEGIAEGPVRVARTLEDAKDMQPGEILIATFTDIGWSPYFPMLAGVVTELGGLLSHGAVVAREYGLPCIVSAQNATNLFVTGDLARLDAGKGTLEKL